MRGTSDRFGVARSRVMNVFTSRYIQCDRPLYACVSSHHTLHSTKQELQGGQVALFSRIYADRHTRRYICTSSARGRHTEEPKIDLLRGQGKSNEVLRNTVTLQLYICTRSRYTNEVKTIIFVGRVSFVAVYCGLCLGFR